MKTNLLCYVLCIGMVLPVFAMGMPVQDLDRVNDIVNSARAMADGLRNNPIQAQNGRESTQLANPFASSQTGAAGAGFQTANGTGVDVGSNNIRINAGGREFNIPRVGTNTAGVSPSPRTNLRVTDAMREATYYAQFADAVKAFRQSDFETANTQIAAASQARTHQFQEFHSLCRFAVRDYKSAAELAYAWTANRPVSGWNQVRSFYGNKQTYAEQYVALQNAVRSPSADTSTRFLLGYHHLMLGHREHAAMVLNEVLNELPNDPVVLNLLKECEMGPPMPVGRR